MEAGIGGKRQRQGGQQRWQRAASSARVEKQQVARATRVEKRRVHVSLRGI